MKGNARYKQIIGVDAITLLHSLMEERNLKAKDLEEILGVSKGLVSDILN